MRNYGHYSLSTFPCLHCVGNSRYVGPIARNQISSAARLSGAECCRLTLRCRATRANAAAMTQRDSCSVVDGIAPSSGAADRQQYQRPRQGFTRTEEEPSH